MTFGLGLPDLKSAIKQALIASIHVCYALIFPLVLGNPAGLVRVFLPGAFSLVAILTLDFGCISVSLTIRLRYQLQLKIPPERENNL